MYEIVYNIVIGVGCMSCRTKDLMMPREVFQNESKSQKSLVPMISNYGIR